MTVMSKPKSFQEIVDLARGQILIGIGKGEYESTVWEICVIAHRHGFEEGVRSTWNNKNSIR